MSLPAEQHPKIRYIDAFPVETEHGQMIAVRDPGGIAKETLLLSPDIFYLLQFFDGRHSEAELRQEYLRAFSRILDAAQFRQILDNLDQHFFLDSTTFSAELSRQCDEFMALPVRPAAHRGESYASGPNELRAQLGTHFTKLKGEQNGVRNKRPMKGMIVPHIDIRCGGECYAHAYDTLKKSEGADCFVILGTGHSGLKNLYSLLEKDFGTPYGTVPYDRQFGKLFKSKFNHFDAADLLAHKNEHTIEFQTVFLQHVLKGKHEFTIVPILCSFSHLMLETLHFARERKIVEDFSRALQQTISEFPGRVCVIASVDLSHVGLRYGDDSAPDEKFMAKVRNADTQILEKAAALDPDGFFDIFQDNDDRFRVCGFSPIYTLLKSIAADKGELLDYSEAIVDPHKSVVTFASMIFY